MWTHFNEETLEIEKHPVLVVPGTRIEKLLTWAAAFTVFGQQYIRKPIRLIGHGMCAYVVKTDPLVPLPSGWKGVAVFIP